MSENELMELKELLKEAERMSQEKTKEFGQSHGIDTALLYHRLGLEFRSTCKKVDLLLGGIDDKKEV